MKSTMDLPPKKKKKYSKIRHWFEQHLNTERVTFIIYFCEAMFGILSKILECLF